MANYISKNYGNQLYFVFRVMVGLLFVQHGLQKLFGFFGADKVELYSLFGLAGVIEFIGGIMIVVGFYTRIAAFIGGANMIGAWFIAHVPNGWIPVVNRGELALLYLACFLVLFAYGARKWSLDEMAGRK